MRNLQIPYHISYREAFSHEYELEVSLDKDIELTKTQKVANSRIDWEIVQNQAELGLSGSLGCDVA